MPTQSIPKVRRRLSEAEIRAWEAFLRASAVTTLALEREAAARAGQPLGDHFLLVQVARAAGPGVRPTELARRTGLTKSGVTRAVDRLVAQRLVERRACPTDARSHWVVLTSGGRRLLTRAAPSHLRAVAKHFADPLTPQELEVLTRAFERIAGTAD